MRGEQVEGLALPGPVLHELARQLDGIPGHAANTSDTGGVDLGEHVMQAMPELVEQGLDLVMAEQCRVVADRRGDVAGQKGDWQLDARFAVVPVAADREPGAAAFVRPRVEIHIEMGPSAAILVTHGVEAHIRVPDVVIGFRGNMYAVQALDDPKQSVDGLIHGEIGAQVLGRDVVAGLS